MNQVLIKKLLAEARAKPYLNQNQVAFELSERALSLLDQEGDLDDEACNILIIVSNFLKDEKITEEVIDIFRKIIQLLDFDGILNSFGKIQLIDLLKKVGEIYLIQEKYNHAEKSYQVILTVAADYPIEQVKIYLKLSDINTASRSYDRVIEVLKLAEAVISSHEIPEIVQIQCFQNFSDYYVQQGNYSDIFKYASKVVELAKSLGNGEYEARALNICAIPYAVRGEYKKAFEYMNTALEKAESLGLRKIIASTLVNIGNVFSALHNYEESIYNYKKVLDYYKGELIDISVGITYFNLGSSYLALNDLESSEENLKAALVIGEKLEHKLLISRIYFELVKIYIERDDLETAITYSFEAEKVYPKTGNPSAYETYLANRCMLNLLRKKYHKAIKHGEEAVSYCIKAKNIKTLKRTYKAISEAYKAIGDYKKAFEYLALFSETSEEFILQIRERRMMNLEIQYSLKDKEKEIELLKKEMLIAKLKLSYQSEIESQNDKLKMSNQELRQFTYAISHDLKEPLRMISSFSNLWYRKNKDTNDETDEEYFYFIRDGAERMTNMLQGLLDYAIVGKKARKPETIDMNEMVTDIQTILYVQIQENQPTFEIENLPTVYTHEVLLFQLMQNLISNAIKFKRAKTYSVIRITSKEDAKYYTIGIHDNGIGIAVGNIENIFKIFKRLHTKEEYEGTGIGLSLCEKIVYYLGGKIWMNSTLDEGSSFYFSLPK
jgi:signal transduction histidine kinase